MKGRILSKRANKRQFRRTAGYTNAKNIKARPLMRGGQRLQ